jgi:hypothetical protein
MKRKTLLLQEQQRSRHAAATMVGCFGACERKKNRSLLNPKSFARSQPRAVCRAGHMGACSTAGCCQHECIGVNQQAGQHGLKLVQHGLRRHRLAGDCKDTFSHSSNTRKRGDRCTQEEAWRLSSTSDLGSCRPHNPLTGTRRTCAYAAHTVSAVKRRTESQDGTLCRGLHGLRPVASRLHAALGLRRGARECPQAASHASITADRTNRKHMQARTHRSTTMTTYAQKLLAHGRQSESKACIGPRR